MAESGCYRWLGVSIITCSTMRLDPSYLNFLTREEFRVLVAIEMGMKNHEFVPLKLIHSIANLKTGDAYKIIRRLLKFKFVNHVSIKYDGYRLNYLGYDYLALQTFMKRGTITSVIGKLGVGKESDIYTCTDSEGNTVVLKFARLGRTSFRTIKLNRDYIKNRTAYNWLYLSRISSTKEFAFMQTLYKAGFPTPVPIDWNRHGIIMSLIDGVTLTNLVYLDECERLFKESLDLLVKFAENGLIHSDFNQFNLLLQMQNKSLKVIDFPQCVSTSHTNAEFYFNRDVECIYTFFDKLAEKSGVSGFNVADHPMPQLQNVVVGKNLDMEVKASGYVDNLRFSEVDMKQFEEYGEFLRRLKREKPELEDEKEGEKNEEEEDNYLSGQNNEKEVDYEGEDVEGMALEVEKQVEQIKEEGSEQSGEEEDSGDMGEGEEDARFEGMTAFQKRQILKQQRLKQRNQKKKGKEEKSAHQQIKQIVRRKPRENKRATHNKNKGTNKVNPYDVLL